MPSIYPRLAYRDEVAALEFLTRAFGLRERREQRLESPAGMLAWLELGDGVVMICRAGPGHDLSSPLEIGKRTSLVMLHVDDVDAIYERAVAAGARIAMPLADQPFGRRFEALDPEGQRWSFLQAPR